MKNDSRPDGFLRDAFDREDSAFFGDQLGLIGGSMEENEKLLSVAEA